METITTKKIRTHRGVIVSAIKETNDTWTLNIFVGDKEHEYLAGQFISLSPYQFPELLDFTRYFAFKKGRKEPVRAYSLASAPHEKYLSITIKPENYEPHVESYPPLLSPLLASDVLVGREIEFLGYSGAYIMPENQLENYDTIIHLVAGSGIVPNFSIIKDELVNNKHPSLKHKLIYVNKTSADIIFHEKLNHLNKQFSNRFSVHYYLTKENEINLGKNYIFGRPTLSEIKALCETPSRTLFFACGPAITKWQKKQAALEGVVAKPRFMEWAFETLLKLNVNDKQIKREVYG